MEWSIGVDSWSGTLELNLKCTCNSILVVKFVLGRTYATTKCEQMPKLYGQRISNRN